MFILTTKTDKQVLMHVSLYRTQRRGHGMVLPFISERFLSPMNYCGVLISEGTSRVVTRVFGHNTEQDS